MARSAILNVTQFSKRTAQYAFCLTYRSSKALHVARALSAKGGTPTPLRALRLGDAIGVGDAGAVRFRQLPLKFASL
jgi:hypothetical protein